MTKKITFQIKGIHCQSCVFLIKDNVQNLPGIVNVALDIDSQKAEIMYDDDKTKESDIIEKIKEAGDYTVKQLDQAEEIQENSSVQTIENSAGQKSFSPKKSFIAALVISVALNLLFLSNPDSRDVLKNFLASLSQTSNTIQDNQREAPSQNVDSPIIAQQPDGGGVSFTITKDNHIRGDFNAPITLVEFSDFECPFCARHLSTLNKLLSAYGGKVRLVYKHFPLGFHANAQKAAEASECAGEQGKFWEYHDKLFENYQDYSLNNFKQWANDLGLNGEKFNNCLDSGEYAQKVQDDATEGAQKGVNGTPATFVNGQLISGALPYDSFKQAVDRLLQ